MARSNSLSNYLIDIATAIRNKAETTEQIPASEFDTKILEISTGTGINGTVKEYTASASVNRGQFVKLVSEKVQKVTSSSDTILGVAKTSGTSGQTVEVVVPEI
jgi:hypothetical protein